MAALSFMFTVFLWIAARKLNRWSSTMLRLKMEKSRLADELSSVLADLERKVERRTTDLRMARDEANRANQMKSRFLAAASHDLGQPFQAMRLFIDLLDSRLKDTPHHELLQALERAHESGQRMLSSLLDLSRLESGTVELRIERFPAGDLIDRLEMEFRPLAESRGFACASGVMTVKSSAIRICCTGSSRTCSATRSATRPAAESSCLPPAEHDAAAGGVGHRRRHRRRSAGRDLRGVPPDRSGGSGSIPGRRLRPVHRPPDRGAA